MSGVDRQHDMHLHPPIPFNSQKVQKRANSDVSDNLPFHVETPASPKHFPVPQLLNLTGAGEGFSKMSLGDQ
jgi:hypothetical protein